MKIKNMRVYGYYKISTNRNVAETGKMACQIPHNMGIKIAMKPVFHGDYISLNRLDKNILM